MKIILSLLLFIVQPVFWIGLIRSYLNARHRIDRTRNQFNTSIYSRLYELRHFGIGAIGFGVLSSVITILLGINLPISWIIIYEILLIINLIFISGAIFPVSIALISSIGWFLLDSNWINGRLNLIDSAVNNTNYLVVISLIILASGIFILLNGGKFNIPRTYYNQRDLRVPGYPFKELTVFPMVIMVPGHVIQQIVPFWPTFNIGQNQVSFLLLPVLIGLRFTIFKHLPRPLFKKLGKQIISLGILGMVLAAIDHFYPQITIISLVILLGLYWTTIFSIKRIDKSKGIWSSEAVNGVRVVGIEPNTPAAKMDINIGDIIVSVNRKSVTNEDEFYESLLNYPTYCHLKLLNRENRLKITETAIFNNSPHEIGIIVFKT